MSDADGKCSCDECEEIDRLRARADAAETRAAAAEAVIAYWRAAAERNPTAANLVDARLSLEEARGLLERVKASGRLSDMLDDELLDDIDTFLATTSPEGKP